MTNTKSLPQCWLLGMLEKDILGLDKQLLMLLDLDYRGFILKNFMYHHQNALKVGKAAKATVHCCISNLGES